jgi:hypothetical protein
MAFAPQVKSIFVRKSSDDFFAVRRQNDLTFLLIGLSQRTNEMSDFREREMVIGFVPKAEQPAHVLISGEQCAPNKKAFFAARKMLKVNAKRLPFPCKLHD